MATDPDPAGLKGLAALSEQVRASARWLIGAFAAVGAILAPGLGLAGIGSLHGWRLWAAAISAVVAVLVAIAAVAAIVRFLGAGRTSIAELADRERSRGTDDDLVAYFHRNSTLLRRQADDLQTLHERYNEARERLAAAQEAAREAGPDRSEELEAAVNALEAARASVEASARLYGPGDLSLGALADAEAGAEQAGHRTRAALAYLREHPELFQGMAESAAELRQRLLDTRAAAAQAESGDEPGDSPEPVEWAEARVTMVKAPIVQIESVAEFQDLRLTFLGRRWFVAGATLVVAIAMATFAVASHPPPRERGDFSGKRLNDLDLSGAKLEKADFSGATFTDADLYGADVDGAKWDHTRFVKTRCPDGKRSQDVGGTCLRHLKGPVLTPPPLGPTGALPWRRSDGRG